MKKLLILCFLLAGCIEWPSETYIGVTCSLGNERVYVYHATGQYHVSVFFPNGISGSPIHINLLKDCRRE